MGESARPGCEDHEAEGRADRFGHKVEEAVDLETGAVVAVTAPEELGDTQTMSGTLGCRRR